MSDPVDIDRGVLRTLPADPVTGALVRGGLDDCLDGAIARARLTGDRCSVFVFDVDHLKTVNDAYGHARGDAVLRVIVERTIAVVRGADLLVRYGGDEFVLVLPETARPEAMQVALRLVDKIGGEPFPGNPPLSVSISLGLATFPDDAVERDRLIEVADRRNYLAKRRGRGRAVGDDLALGRPVCSGRLLERDVALATARDFLGRLAAGERGVLRVAGERGVGHSRFLAEVGTLARMRGFEVRGVGSAVDHSVDEAAESAGGPRRILVLADTDGDAAEVSGLVGSLAASGGVPVVGLLHAVHDLAGGSPPLPSMGTVVLTPLSVSALHIWLRTMLRGEPAPALVEWLARRSAGLVARAERELARLSAGGHLEQGADGSWGVSSALVARAERAWRRLPAPLSSMIGRERDTVRVVELLADRRLVTLVGTGGIGKTRLSLAVATAMAEDFADGAVFVPLAEATTTQLVISALAEVMEVTEIADEPLADTVVRTLSGLDLLLVLDNFEQVLSAGSFVTCLLTAAPGVRVLVTSRQRLRLPGEQVYPVPPLAVPDLDHLPTGPEETTAALAASPALALFVSRAEQAVYGLTFTPADLRAAAHVCCRLDGLPLAIELAAANCDVLSPTRILAQLSERLELPAAGPHDLPARQRTLKATMDWSFALLDGDDQDLLTRLAVFAGGCPADAIPAICLPPDAPTATLATRLSALVDKHLLGVQDTPDGARYTMLETIRAYAGERLAAAADDGIARRHAGYFAAFAERVDVGLSGAEHPTWHARVGREYPNLRAAYTWAMADRATATATAARIVLGVQRHWRKGWHTAEGRDWHDRLLTMAGRQLPDDVRAWLTYSAALLAVMQDDYATARPLSEECLRLGRHLADPGLTANALNVAGLIAKAAGDLDGARAFFGECMAIQQARGIADRVLAAARGNLSVIATIQGDLATAHALTLRNAELNREIGNLHGLALDLSTLGEISLEQGDVAGARPLFAESIEISRKIGDTSAEACVTYNLGRLARFDGDPVGASQKFAATIRLGHRVGERMVALSALNELSDLLSTVDPARAARILGAVDAIRDLDGIPMTKRQETVRDGTLREIRTALTESDLAAAVAAGRAMPFDDLVAETLALDRQDAPGFGHRPEHRD